ncbi:MAG: cytochrome c peroxidase [Isosphaeraceae bacterium]
MTHPASLAGACSRHGDLASSTRSQPWDSSQPRRREPGRRSDLHPDSTPSALAVSPDGQRVYLANERSGSISVVEPEHDRVAAEAAVGQSLVDLAWLPNGRHLVAVDRGAGQVRLVDTKPEAPTVVGSLPVAADPVGITALTGENDRVAIASMRSQTITILEASRSDPPRLRSVATVALPFPPRRVAWLKGPARLVAADAYGGMLALIDPERGIVMTRTIPGHNLRGLAASPDGRWLVVAHQVLERTAATTFDNVHFGALMRNNLLVVPVADLVGPLSDVDLVARSRVADLEGFGNGGGDPAGVAFDPEGGIVVALAGVGEVGLSNAPTGQLRRVRAGIRPTAVVVRPDGREAYAADTAGDALWVIAIPGGLQRRSISLGPRPEPDAAERGERLFFDARLSHDHWLSCQSCHTDGHSSGRLADTLGDGTFGTPKRILSLLGAGTTGPWGWNGSVARLEDQVRKSVTSTMQGEPLSDSQVADLTAFLRALPAAEPADRTPSAMVERGRHLFAARRCDRCHAPPDFTTSRTFDVGLPDEKGQRLFNPPSLRGVGSRSPLLHDGRAASLDALFRDVRHPRGEALTDAERSDLIAFLRSL